jgi:hypothetical protein
MGPAEADVLPWEFRSGGPSVREAFFALHDPKMSLSRVARVQEAAGLAENWRRALAKRLLRPHIQ